MADPLVAAAARKTTELTSKLAAVRREIEDWHDATEEGKEYEKHYSQVRRIATWLDPALEDLRVRLTATAATAQSLLRDAQSLETDILDLHRVWEFFRAKIALRATPALSRFLTVADDFAWRCYEPAITKAGASRREPPLTFLNAESSPYAMARGTAYTVEGPAFTNPAARELVKRLPVPVVGIPWFQINHLPDLLIIAHEVGHHVEDDLGLTPALEAAVDAANVSPAHRAAWQAWIGETFADIYGVLAAGSAYALALMDFLLTDPTLIVNAEWTDGRYPTPFLRIGVVIATVEIRTRKKVDGELGAAWTAWKTDFPNHAMDDYNADCVEIVWSVIGRPIADGSAVRIADLIGSINQNRVDDAAKVAFNTADDFVSRDARELVAASVYAYRRDPAAYAADSDDAPQSRLIAHIVVSRDPGKRRGENLDAVKKLKAADLAAGEAFLKRWRANERT